MHVETGEPNVKAIIFDKQVKFLTKIRAQPPNYVTQRLLTLRYRPAFQWAEESNTYKTTL